MEMSCKKDFLDITPKTQLAQADAFATPARVESQVNSVYNGLKSGQFLGGRYQIYMDIRGEEFINNLSNGVTGLDTWRFNVNSNTNEVVNLWSAAYTAINRANLLIDGLVANPNSVSADLAKQYTAEAKFCRALAYFELIQLYAKPFLADNGASPAVPLRLKGELTAENNDLKRSTVAEIYTQILKDLNEAEADLPLTAIPTRAHRNAAIALKTRVYLAQGNYAQVVTEANKIVSAAAPFTAATGNINTLEAKISAVFEGSYVGSEAILSLPMTDLSAPGTQNQLAYYYNVAAGGGNEEYYFNTAANGIYSNPALSGATSLDARKGFVGISKTKFFLTKFKKPSPYTDYVPVIRYAEVLLNLAEASVRTGDVVRATALLNAVRHRSDPAYTFSAAETSTPATLLITISTEKRLELLGEGFRSFDITRLNLPFPAKGAAPAVESTSPAYIWPISSGEIQNNKSL
ncbi:RagB/SusD family nutrient uptake outer membrane protein [Pedobacter sp. HMF7647]|uniref:RagB/SusD family nutrient uptake outer membrane protein n=2 Tax=Hufsiella arboris TaxID=2695275 RepID=A0A7K1Y5M2_9SPHI|nr:RagB/SusD family nutrient uptake outer membrane protein [Hufsiella arboris]